MKKSHYVLLLVMTVVVVVAGSIAWKSTPADSVADVLSDPTTVVPTELVFTTLSGEEVRFADYRGKILVVNSWASWCPFCLQELPDFAELQRLYPEEVAVLAINRKESRALIDSYLGSVAPLVELTLLLDETDSFYNFIGGFTMPETVFYNQAGDRVLHKRGPMKLEEMQQHVEAIRTQ